jgi:hypothetical protein
VLVVQDRLPIVLAEQAVQIPFFQVSHLLVAVGVATAMQIQLKQVVLVVLVALKLLRKAVKLELVDRVLQVGTALRQMQVAVVVHLKLAIQMDSVKVEMVFPQALLELPLLVQAAVQVVATMAPLLQVLLAVVEMELVITLLVELELQTLVPAAVVVVLPLVWATVLVELVALA